MRRSPLCAPSSPILGEGAWLERLHRRIEEGSSYAHQRQVYEENRSLRQAVAALVEELEQETAPRENE
jgi:gamma-glutamyl:cysteine ligase YbdK (ATP-grasp superfamily)